jgi:hypothetical protein
MFREVEPTPRLSDDLVDGFAVASIGRDDDVEAALGKAFRAGPEGIVYVGGEADDVAPGCGSFDGAGVSTVDGKVFGIGHRFSPCGFWLGSFVLANAIIGRDPQGERKGQQ